jgi:hypothetical protein
MNYREFIMNFFCCEFRIFFNMNYREFIMNFFLLRI